MDDDGIERLLGVLTERTERLPQMATDLADLKGRVQGLPCVAHTAHIEGLVDRVGVLERATSGMTIKIGVVWGLGIVTVSAIINWLMPLLPGVLVRP